MSYHDGNTVPRLVTAFLGGFCLLNSLCFAQDIEVRSGSFTDMSVSPALNLANANHFGTVSTSGNGEILGFTIYNNDPDTTLDIIGSVTVSGPDAAHFSIFTQPDSELDPYAESTFYVQFDPTTSGEKNAQIVIANDDPDLAGNFTFSVRGTGAALVFSGGDLRVSGTGQVAIKAVKSSLSDVILSGRFAIRNFEPVEVPSIHVSIYTSVDRYYQSGQDVLRTEFDMKGAPPDDGDPVTYPEKEVKGKFSFQMTINQQNSIPRFVFVRVSCVGIPELNHAANMTRIPLSIDAYER